MSLAHYLLQVNIYLVIFYCFYKLLLDSETYFVLNRIYLLASGLLSLTIPFLRFEWFVKQEVTKPIYVGFDQLNDFVTQASIVEDTPTTFNWGNFIVIIYLLGILFCIGRFTFQLLSVRKLLRNISNGTAFSFFRKKIISSNVPELATVHLHEDVHVKQLHTVDVLFFEVLGIFAWFNPIIYVYKKTIKNIHEYLADEAAAKFQGDKEAYSLLLLSQAFGVRSNTLTNGFFTKSLIKKRILMLHKQRSKKTAILKYGLFVPLFALTLVLSSATIRKNNRILEMASKIPLDNMKVVVNQAIETPLSIVNLAQAPAIETPSQEPTQFVTLGLTIASPATESEEANSFSGLYSYLGSKIKYPMAAIEKKIQGNTIINFSVKNGKITDAITQSELGDGCDEAVIAELLAYDEYFENDGNFSLKVTFKLNGVEGTIKNENASISPNYTALQNIIITAMPIIKETTTDQTVYNFISIEQPPTYPGGIDQFYRFLGNNMKYPAAAIDNEVQGNVHISFTVEKDGSLTDIKVVRKLGFGTDEEALRVVKLAKKWNPGMQNGRPVRVRYNIPVKFSLDPDQSERQAKAIASIRLKTYLPTDEPMVIVDNEIKNYGYLKTLDSKTIESINVLTSVNAISVYGKAAENGAVIVKSKGYKPRVITATFNNKN
jgi:TonB family protein